MKNSEILVAAFDRLNTGDASYWLDAMADDIRYDFVGGSSWDQVYQGKQAFREGLGRAVMAKMAGAPKPRITRLIDAGEHVVVEFTNDTPKRSGEPYSNRYCMIMRFDGGKIVDLTEYCDTWRVVTQLGERI